VWYLCDDAYVSKIDGGINAAIRVAEEKCGEPILFAYKEIKN
jgi:hypothetical protein